jgi:hypothetical protein
MKSAHSRRYGQGRGPRTMTATHHLTAVLAVGVARLVAFKPYSQLIPHTRHPSSLPRIPRPYKTLAWSSVARDGYLAGLSASRAWTRRRVTAAALSRRRCTSRSRTSLRRQPRAKARTAGPQSLRPSHRDANARLAAGVDGEVLGRTTARTSRRRL